MEASSIGIISTAIFYGLIWLAFDMHRLEAVQLASEASGIADDREARGFRGLLAAAYAIMILGSAGLIILDINDATLIMGFQTMVMIMELGLSRSAADILDRHPETAGTRYSGMARYGYLTASIACAGLSFVASNGLFPNIGFSAALSTNLAIAAAAFSFMSLRHFIKYWKAIYRAKRDLSIKLQKA